MDNLRKIAVLQGKYWVSDYIMYSYIYGVL